MKDSVRQYIKKIKDPNDEIYDPKLYQRWTEVILQDEQGKPITNIICKYEMASGQIIYTTSNKYGKVDRPLNGLKNTTLIVHPFSEKAKYVFEIISELRSAILCLLFMLAFPFLLILLLVFEQSQNEEYKKRINISKAYEETLSLARQELGTIYIYTNDTDEVKLQLEPHIKRAYFPDEHLHKRPKEWFLERKEEVGFIVFLKNHSKLFKQMEILDDSSVNLDHPDFKLTTVFQYTAEEYEKKQAYKLELEEKKADHDGRNLASYDNIYGGHSYILNQKALANKKNAHSSTLQKLLTGPEKLFLRDSTFKFYFTPYRHSVSKEQFEQAVCDFQEMFMADPADRSCCKIRALTVQ